MVIQIAVSVFLTVWITGWMVMIGWLGASKAFMSEAVWWRMLQVALAFGIWPILLGASMHKAILPNSTVDD